MWANWPEKLVFTGQLCLDRDRGGDVKEVYRFASVSENTRDFCREKDIEEIANLCQESMFIKEDFGSSSLFEEVWHTFLSIYLIIQL